jgi:glyoxylase-like metal-dependent hydrolase (beta-lactamase superfamily II)
MLKWAVGGVTISAIVEATHAFAPNVLMPAATDADFAAIEWLAPNFVTDKGEIELWVQAFVIETPSRRIVVDTCMGNDKPRTYAGNMLQTDFLQRFEAAGFPRESIDTVLCTHLHIDHVGWNTTFDGGRWIPTFPNARYLIGATEFEYWKEQTNGEDAAIFADSVQPVFDAGLVDLVATDHRICEEVQLVSTPGHTPGHVSVSIMSNGQQALITGDIMHHPSQVARPDWATFVDYDPQACEVTRRGVLEKMADQPVLVIGTHFAPPTAGVIVRDGKTYRFKI